MRPLGFFVADKNMEASLRGLFSRSEWHQSIGCTRVDVMPSDVRVASGYADPGLYAHAAELLRSESGIYERIVVMVDAEWEGSPGPLLIKERIRDHIVKAGWHAESGLALVIDPEVDVWLWTRTDHTARALGWPDWRTLKSALEAKSLWLPTSKKPTRPKEAAEWALREKKQARSSIVYQRFASSVGLGRCTDPSFLELRAALQKWFPVESN